MINHTLIQRSSNLFARSLFKFIRPTRTASIELPGKLSRRFVSSDSAAYDGDGKTTVTVLNQLDYNVNLVNTYSKGGFRLQNNLFVYGSMILFPTQVYSWNVRRGIDITPESLLVFDLIMPKLKILIIGYGQQNEPHDPNIASYLKKRGIACEILPTPSAVTTYNYLVHDSVHVAGAFVTVKDDVVMDRADRVALSYNDIFLAEKDYVPQQSEHDRVTLDDRREIRRRMDEGKGKKEFDE